MLKVIFLFAFVFAVTANEAEAKKHHCETDADCAKGDKRCDSANVVCQCMGKSWCSIKIKCDPAKNGIECPSYATECVKLDGETEYFCSRRPRPSGAPPGVSA